MLKDVAEFMEFLQTGLTPYHVVKNVCSMLTREGFIALSEGDSWELEPNTGYYVTRNGSSIVAFKTGELNVRRGFNIVASHTDSPCLKIKNNALPATAAYQRLNVETYGGALYYTMLDRPLRIAGRVIERDGDRLRAVNVQSDFLVTIPSVAIHQNREANDGLKLNPQVDLLPLIGMGDGEDVVGTITHEKDVVDYDLFVVPDTEPYTYGAKDEFLAAPRLDDLTGVFGGMKALIKSNCSTISVCACFDNEEVGSGTKQGAGSTLLKDVLNGIICAVAEPDDAVEELSRNAVANSFLVSMDNAHALHPNHPEKCDPTNRCLINKGIVIKHHANQAYLTDGMSSAVLKNILDKANVPYQDFFNRSDARSGSTLGTISNRQVSLHTVDIGLAQLAMHSFCETMGTDDLAVLVDGLKAFYQTDVRFFGDEVVFEG